MRELSTEPHRQTGDLLAGSRIGEWAWFGLSTKLGQPPDRLNPVCSDPDVTSSRILQTLSDRFNLPMPRDMLLNVESAERTAGARHLIQVPLETNK